MAVAARAENEQIAVIDLTPFRTGGREGKQAVAAAVREAAETIGFLYIRGHGVDQDIVDGAFGASQALFNLPAEAKNAVKVNAAHRGYVPFSNAQLSQELKPNYNETFLFGLDLPPSDPDVAAGVPLHGPNQWPPGSEAMKRSLDRYFWALNDLGYDILRIFGLALDIEEEFFLPYFIKHMPFLRLIHYPPQPPTRADNEFGIAPHTDYGFATILAQDEVGGLQVKRRNGGWIDAPYIPGTFVVNIADMLMRWTNDRWVSTPHRVINTSGRRRLSIPFFFDPNYRTNVSCIPSCRGPNGDETYPPISSGDYLRERFDKTYDYRKKK